MSPGMTFFDKLKKLLKSNPWMSSAIITMYFMMTIYGIFVTTGESNISGLKERIDQLMNENESLVNTLELNAKRERDISYFKDIIFKEKWESKNKEEEILRLFDYAEYATEKKDYERSIKLLNEANSIQSTLRGNFLLGRVYYMKGELRKTLKHWNYIANQKLEGEERLILFYLSIVYHELGDDDKMELSIDQYSSY